ncbi:MAG: prolipoprotein diacylglyceryl transferase [Clostridiales bacterium]|nr:prolipoprotein diacylglyceryl transferase [Clostridiales bacterium]
MQGIKISFPMFGENFIIDPPTNFTVFGIPVYYYAVIVAAGFLLAVLYILLRRRTFGLTQDNILDMFIICVPAGIVGARLYFVLFTPADYFGAGKWLNIFDIRQGGLAIYGGVIAAVIAIIIYSRKKKIPTTVFVDVGALGLLIGQAVGRWGNFINREAYGGETDIPWKMGLSYGGATVYVHPTFLYESVWNIIGFLLIHMFSKKYRKYDGQLFLLYLAWYGFGRFWIEGLRTDSLYLFNTDIRVSQLVAVISMGTAVYIMLRVKLRKKPTSDSLFVNRAASAQTNQEAEEKQSINDAPAEGTGESSTKD